MGRILLFKPLEKNDKIDKSQAFLEENQDIKTNIAGPDDKLIKLIFKIDRKISKIIEKFEDNEIQDQKLLKWRFAALVMDRLFLCLSIIYTIIAFIFIIMIVPNFYKPI